MPLWTWFGLRKGKATTSWPMEESDTGQRGIVGMPRFTSDKCTPECQECASVCPTSAITVRPRDKNTEQVVVDFGRCIACQLCVEVCPSDAVRTSSDWAFGVRDRADLIFNGTDEHSTCDTIQVSERKQFRRSLHIRHVDAGSCNGCESELQALNNPFYNLHRFGIFFTPSPRFADLLLVTGPVTHAMHDALRRTYEAMPEPRWVMAFGTCAVSGGLTGGGYACGNGVEEVLPVDLYLPGCPPNPAAIIEALLMFLDRLPQKVHEGCVRE